MPNRSSIEEDWSVRGFSCDLWIDPPGQCWENFTHAVDELVMVLEGRLEVEIAGIVHQPEAGEELFIPAGALHSVRNRGSTTARWLYGYRRV
jgi:quercetin dioxygenase-like cupin family protein